MHLDMTLGSIQASLRMLLENQSLVPALDPPHRHLPKRWRRRRRMGKDDEVPGGVHMASGHPLTKGLPSDHWKSPSMVRSFKPIHWYSLYWSGGGRRQEGIEGGTAKTPLAPPVRKGLKEAEG